MGHRERVRVEFGLSPEVADAIYRYAKAEGLSLSEAGTRLLKSALDSQGHAIIAARTAGNPVEDSDRRGGVAKG
jgi:hypothetical protein